jgi:alpha-tubulin suppressor-like RCC1 family protein
MQPVLTLPSSRIPPSSRRAASRTVSSLAACLVLAACAPEARTPDDPLVLRDGLDAAPAHVSLGEHTTCATLGSGHAVCWGHGEGGRLGQGRALATSEPDPLALDPLALGKPAVMVATNGTQGFALLEDGSIRAFGDGDGLALGLGSHRTIGDDETPLAAGSAAVVPLDGPAAEVVAGKGFGCARLVDGRVQCWGRGEAGQLGRGATTGPQPPADVLLGGVAVELVAGTAHACARLHQGTVRCWGLDEAGRLGYGTAVGSAPPAVTGDVPLGGVATHLAAGGAHTCAVLDTRAVRCWGDGRDGRLGLGHTQAIGDDETPAAAGDVALGGEATSIAAGLRHTCAVLGNGAMRCWGDGTHGQLGLPSSRRIGDDERPGEVDAVDMGGDAVAAVFAGALAEHTCAALDDGRLRCWGRNDRGQTGLGYASPQDPVEGPPGDLPDVIIVEDPDA